MSIGPHEVQDWPGLYRVRNTRPSLLHLESLHHGQLQEWFLLLFSEVSEWAEQVRQAVVGGMLLERVEVQLGRFDVTVFLVPLPSPARKLCSIPVRLHAPLVCSRLHLPKKRGDRSHQLVRLRVLPTLDPAPGKRRKMKMVHVGRDENDIARL